MDEGYQITVLLLDLFNIPLIQRFPFCLLSENLKDYRDKYYRYIPQGYPEQDAINEPEDAIDEVEVLKEEPNYNVIFNQLKLFTKKLESIPENEEDNNKKNPLVSETKLDNDILGSILLPLAIPTVDN